MENKISFIKSLTFQLDITSRVFYNYAKQLFEENAGSKLTLEEFTVLETLVYYPHLNEDAIAKIFARPVGSVEKVIAKLLKKKMITPVKKNENSDIQVKYYELTSLGDRMYLQNKPMQDTTVVMLSKFISENELVAFTKTMLKIRNILISLGYVDV